VADNIQDQLSATGYAQVVAIIGPETMVPASTGTPMAIASAAHREAAASVSAVAAETERHFIVDPRGKVRVYPYLGMMLGTVNHAGLRGLRDHERVHDVHGAPRVSLIRPTRVATAKKPAGVTWGLERLGIPELWEKGLTGDGVLVGHLDTGIDSSHPAFESAIANFAEFDFLGNHVACAKAHDTHVHGTHTAGTIAGRQVGATSFGVAPGAMLVSAIVIDGGDTVARLLGGMNWAIANGARILNISVGIRGHTDAFLALARALRARNVLLVSAVGNEG
jgi:subtilisin family serine protease